MQLGLSTRVGAELETGWNLERKHGVANTQQRAAKRKTESLDSKSTVPTVVKFQNRNDVTSILLKSGEGKVITTRSHLIHAVRECFEQMHRGDRFIFKHQSNSEAHCPAQCF